MTLNDKDRSYNLRGEVERRFADWRMRPISEEAERMINLVERGPLGSGGGNGDTSSRLRTGVKMSTEPLSLSMGQTWVSALDSLGSDVVCDRYSGKGS